MKKLILIGLLSSGLLASTSIKSDTPSLKEKVDSLTTEQVERIGVAYSVGKTIKANDGKTFETTLPSIAGVESYWGSVSIGDKYDKNGRLKHLFDSSLGDYQIKMDTARLTIKDNKVLFEKYKDLIYDGERIKYDTFLSNIKAISKYSKIIAETKTKGDSKSIKDYNFAKQQLSRCLELHNEYSKKIATDSKLANKLLNDHKFSAEIAGNYLKDMYNIALARNYKNLYKRAVGRYNGGWSNMNYANAVVDNLNVVSKTVKTKLN